MQREATPIRFDTFFDTGPVARRRGWVFWFADGSKDVTFDVKRGLALRDKMMKAGLILPNSGDAERAAGTRSVWEKK